MNRAAVQVGGFLPFFALWSPLVVATYAWFPAVIWACERLLRRPGFGAACVFGVVLGLEMTAGFPQIVVFSCALMGLRLLWELATRRSWPRWRGAAWLAVGVALPPLLGAVHFAPAFEVLQQSVRTAPMDPETRNGPMGPALDGLRQRVEERQSDGGFAALVMLLAGAALARPGSRRIVAFYVGASALTLALVPDSLLHDLYQSLPGLDRLRGPERLAWVSSLCLCLLTGHVMCFG